MAKTSKKAKIDELTDLGGNARVAGADVDRSSETMKPLGADPVQGDPIETRDRFDDPDTLSAMRSLAAESAANAERDGYRISVTDITESESGVRWFGVEDSESGDSYAFYQLGGEVFCRPEDEFLQMRKNAEDGVPGWSDDSLRYDYATSSEPADSWPVGDRDDCLFAVQSVFSSITGKSYDSDSLLNGSVNERAWLIKRTRLGTDGIAADSKEFHDAKYGTPDENAFKKEIEDKQQKDGTQGALDQQQESAAWHPKLPNVHRRIAESAQALTEAAGRGDVVYEPFDRVLLKIGRDWLPGTVTGVSDSKDGGQIVQVLVQGHTLSAVPKELKPDESYMLNSRWGNVDNRGEYDALNLDPTTRMNSPVRNDSKDYSKDYEDLNDPRVECSIVVDGFRANFQKYWASLGDIKESRKTLRVLSESGDVSEFDAGDVEFAPEDWPWAVVVADGESPDGDESEKPLRKIRINPTSYVEAADDENVECIVQGKRTVMPKRNIKIIS